MTIDIFPPLSINELGLRDNQEDAIAQWEDRLFILCDGMGGHEKGEVASQTVCNSLVTWFSEHVTIDEPFNDQQLKDALEYTYKQLDAKDDGSYKKMGTTLTLLYIHSRGVTAAHIGDSRIYHISPSSYSQMGSLCIDRRLKYISRDHSLVFDLYQAGEITFEEMRTSPQKNIITRAMEPGEDNRVRADIVHITHILPGDYFYLCSDGMLEDMSDEQLVKVFSSDSTDEEKRQFLISSTKNNLDNHSAFIIHVKNVVREAGDDEYQDEERTTRYNALNIHPKLVVSDEEDVSIVEELPRKQEVHTPTIHQEQTASSDNNKKWKYLIMAMTLLVVLLIGTFVCFDFLKSRNDVKKDSVVPVYTPVPTRRSPMPQRPMQPIMKEGAQPDSPKVIQDSNRTNNVEYGIHE